MGGKERLRIHYLQHVPYEGLGAIERWINERGHRLTCTRFHESDPVPSARDLDFLVIMGGPMSVHDESLYGWLTREKRLIEEAIELEKTLLGICLGAQLIADVLGGRVFRNTHREIGWFPVELTPHARASHLFQGFPREIHAFHWHDDTFELPNGAALVASSEGCENQAFVYGKKVLGLQFHLEMTERGIGAIIENCKGELVRGRYVQTPYEMLNEKRLLQSTSRIMRDLLERLEEISS